VAEYAFKHPLTQEVALGSQLKERRRQVHATVAGAIEQQDAEHLDERAALLAHHWEEAGEAFSAARWHRGAADWAGRSDPTQGMRHMRRVLALTDGLEASDERSALRLDACHSLLAQGGWRVGLSTEEAEQLFAEGRALARLSADADKAIGLYIGYAAVVGVGGDVRRYHEISREALDLIDASVSPGLTALLLVGMSYSSFCLGHLRDALEFAERVTSLLLEGDSNAGIETVAFSALDWSFQERGWLRALLGCLDDARALLREAIVRARSRDPGDVLAWSLGATAEISDWSGDSAAHPLAQEARRCALEAVDLAERMGNHAARVHAYRRLGVGHMLHSDWRAAAAVLEGALALARQHRTGLELESLILAYLSRAYLGTGDVARARATAEQAIERAGAQGARYFECLGWLALARALRAEQSATAGEEIERCLDRALELVNETEARAIEPQIIEERAHLAQLRGDDATAAADRQRAHALYVAIGATGHAERLAKEMGL
jgi:adenylate cyclase